MKRCRDVCRISDYFLIRIEIHVRLSVIWKEKKRSQKVDVEKLKENKNHQNYVEIVDEYLKNDRNLKTDNNTELDQLKEILKNSIKQVESNVLGFEERRKPKI